MMPHIFFIWPVLSGPSPNPACAGLKHTVHSKTLQALDVIIYLYVLSWNLNASWLAKVEVRTLRQVWVHQNVLYSWRKYG